MRIPTLLLSGILFGVLPLLATDRVVSVSGTYNTISSAIAASSDGDRILVQSGNYNEDLSISKSLAFLPLLEGTRYTLNGSVKLDGANGKTIDMSGIRILDKVTKIGTYNTRTQFRMFDSYAGNCFLPDPFIHIELYRDTIVSFAQFSSGSVVGNVLPGKSGLYAIILVSGASSLTDDILIIGNSLGGTNGFGIEISSDLRFYVEGNYIVNTGNQPAVQISRTQDLSTPPSTIINNTFYSSTPAALLAVTSNKYYNLYAKNNANIGFNSGFISTQGWTQLVQSNNLFTAPSWINATTGQPTVSSPLLNAGDPDPRYLDLDLSTNDVGCYGGSNSRANFTTPMGSAVVGFMQAPRVVAQGEAVNITAVGFDR